MGIDEDIIFFITFMLASMIQFTKHLKSILHYISIGHLEYSEIRYRFISYYEGIAAQAYKDTVGKVTIGVGFNMDSPQAIDEWQKVFGPALHFHDAYNGKIRLNTLQIRQLFDSNVINRELEVRRIYKRIWRYLQLHERLGIEDAYFNSPVLVKGGSRPSRFWGYMHSYITEKQPKYLESAVEELLYRSNPARHPGIRRRRIGQAFMLCAPTAEEKILAFCAKAADVS